MRLEVKVSYESECSLISLLWFTGGLEQCPSAQATPWASRNLKLPSHHVEASVQLDKTPVHSQERRK